MEAESCQNCGHYHRHYILDEQGCQAINCGHCTYPRLKTRKPYTAACIHFVRGEKKHPNRREYLTMELLHWLRSLEFPPEIREE